MRGCCCYRSFDVAMNIKLIFGALIILYPLFVSSVGERDVYIVNLGEKKGGETYQEVEDHHHSYLLSLSKSQDEARNAILYSYKHSINGFAALLSPEEASQLMELEDVVSVCKSKAYIYKPATTRTWNFLGLDEGGDAKYPEEKAIYGPGSVMLENAGHGRDVIIGMIDSGIWPESESFSDQGMSPVPESWRGICQTGPGFNSSHCNRKIIGARYYMKGFIHAFGSLSSNEFASPRDSAGHGSHTASTAAGRVVANASAYGDIAKGEASGGAPLARLSVYKACWESPAGEGTTCSSEDLLAALDQAIADGVHVLSISLGSDANFPYTEDPLGIGTLHAVRNDIVVACSAGNAGPDPGSVSNTEPWVISVAASSSDRIFFSDVTLGNGQRVTGQSITPLKMDLERPLVYAGEVAAYDSLPQDAEQCLPNTLSLELVEGMVVLCLLGEGSAVEKSLEVRRAGGAGMILGSFPGLSNRVILTWNHIPSIVVGPEETETILNYLMSDSYPTALINPIQTLLNHGSAPKMAAFSSRGPNTLDPSITKPDVTAPGINVLAAWSAAQPISIMPGDMRFASYNLISGTSMSCPHVAAVAALLKAIHPDWSSAAIRSAIMTTASTTNNMNQSIVDETGNIATPFHYGSGHIQPAKAADPGLVYNASYEDYVQYLCTINERTEYCPGTFSTPLDLNYPSISIPYLINRVRVNRRLTNVGPSNNRSTYKVDISPPPGVRVVVSPVVLVFDKMGETKSFAIEVERNGNAGGEYVSYGHGWFSWSDGYHTVRSPISIRLA